jgi:hypothetical protein
MVGEKLERIRWISFDQLHIDVVHRQPAEP